MIKLNIITRCALCTLTAALTLSASAADLSVSGPDGRLKLDFSLLEGGKPSYEVFYDGVRILDPSPLGFVATLGDFSKDLILKESSSESLEYSYTQSRIKRSSIDVKANKLLVTLTNDKKQQISIDFRVSDNDIAFRYVIPSQPDKRYGQKFSIRVMKEATGFDFPSQTRTFLTPQSHAMIGWKGTKPSYEEEYKYDRPMEERSSYGHGYTFPCLFRVPSEGVDYWALVSETGNDSQYCGCRLGDMSGDGLYSVEFPMAEENNGNGTSEPAFSLPGATPWRTITVGSSLKPIVETTVAWDYVEPKYESSHDYKFGKSGWSWIVWQDDATNYDDQMKFVDMASALGWDYILVDAGWDKNIGYAKMEELFSEARKKNVEVFLWYSSSGWWNDIEQSPVNVMADPIARKKDMEWMQKNGVKGIKVDFFGGDKQETFRLYEQILSDADDHGLMVIFHGCTLPRGWERLYPNYVGSEAVLASENMFFGQGSCDREAQDAATHPFIRNSIASMEWGGCFLNRHIRRGNVGGNTRRTTDCHELATTVLFQNAIQNFAITPENRCKPGQVVEDYNAPGAPAPQICVDYMKEVPTTWDETIFIDGYPGKYVVLARRSGDKWYIAGNNATGAPLKLEITLPELQKGGELTLYSDNLKTREPEKSSVKYNGKALKLSMADKGGFVAVY